MDVCLAALGSALILVILLRLYIWRRRLSVRECATSRLIGFLHPYCAAGGGGERVLWLAIRSIQDHQKDVECVVYTGDCTLSDDHILGTAKINFGVTLSHRVRFVRLRCRWLVEARTWPRLTMLGQALGSVLLGFEALVKCPPDLFVDSTGFAFTLPLFKLLGGCVTACYVHYPTISSDMFSVVRDRRETFNNTGLIARSALFSSLKRFYYALFALCYGLAGRFSDKVMVNSTWTRGHIEAIWGAGSKPMVVYPPVSTSHLSEIDLDSDRQPVIISIGQFRPEKDHSLQLVAFARFLQLCAPEKRSVYRLLLVGSCRNMEDRGRVARLRVLAEELMISEQVQFKVNASFSELTSLLTTATAGIHTMNMEHFGIGVVEYMAAGVVPIAHASGGPLLDIVVDYQGGKTGFLARSSEEYAEAMRLLFHMDTSTLSLIRQRARDSVVHRFSDELFQDHFYNNIKRLIST